MPKKNQISLSGKGFSFAQMGLTQSRTLNRNKFYTDSKKPIESNNNSVSEPTLESIMDDAIESNKSVLMLSSYKKGIAMILRNKIDSIKKEIVNDNTIANGLSYLTISNLLYGPAPSGREDIPIFVMYSLCNQSNTNNQPTNKCVFSNNLKDDVKSMLITQFTGYYNGMIELFDKLNLQDIKMKFIRHIDSLKENNISTSGGSRRTKRRKIRRRKSVRR
jgi:hypothetical protein